MWSTLEHLFVTAAINTLNQSIKSPESIKKEGAIIAQIAQVATEADEMANGATWSYTAPKAAAAPTK
jgi:hypothetical protein